MGQGWGVPTSTEPDRSMAGGLLGRAMSQVSIGDLLAEVGAGICYDI